jgi:Mycothiol maleylpyruvate isomerase N-terminal domain
MIELDLAVVTAADGSNLLSAAQTDWLRPIPHCPGWDAADLVGHMGSILGWMTRIVAAGEPVGRADRESPPADRLALAPWYSGHLSRTLGVLTTTAADSPAWTFSSRGDRRVGWWRRRLAVELAIHRWGRPARCQRGRQCVGAAAGRPGRCGRHRGVPDRVPARSACPARRRRPDRHRAPARHRWAERVAGRPRRTGRRRRRPALRQEA